MSVWMVYVTCADESEARRIGQACVRERLAACANIVPGIRSYYHWKGKYHDANESLLILKTRSEKYRRLERRVRALHSYSVPCIVAYPSKASFAGYAAWVRKETR